MSGKFFLFITIILFMLIFFCIPALAALQQEAPLSPEQTQLNLESLEYIWKTINEKHYDPTFGGVDWPALREEMRPRMEKAKTRNEARAILEQMIDRLRLSHFNIIPSEAYEHLAEPTPSDFPRGSTGIDARVVGGQALITHVDSGTPAEVAGVRAGWEILRIGEKEIAPILERLAAEYAGQSGKVGVLSTALMNGLRKKIGTRLFLQFRDVDNRIVEQNLLLIEPKGKKVQFGDLSCLFCGMSAAKAALQDAPPKAETILDGYVEATGGMAAYDKIDNRVTKSTMEIAGTGIKISLTLYQAKPLKAYSVVESTVTGKIESGIDGEVVWEVSATSGPKIKEGKERENQLHLNRMDRFAYWRQAYQKVETVGVEEVSGKSCFKVTATPAAGPVQTLYFDPETHLVIKIATTIEIPQGTIPVESSFSDYQATHGVLLPRKSVMKVATQERIVTVQSIEQNVELPTDRFDAPKEIKTMLQKKNSN